MKTQQHAVKACWKRMWQRTFTLTQVQNSFNNNDGKIISSKRLYLLVLHYANNFFSEHSKLYYENIFRFGHCWVSCHVISFIYFSKMLAKCIHLSFSSVFLGLETRFRNYRTNPWHSDAKSLECKNELQNRGWVKNTLISYFPI